MLGLSMTSTSVGWLLLDRQGPDAFTLDHDAFDVQNTANGTTHDTSQHAAAARGAQAIATASGHEVGSVRLTWSEDVEADATALLKSLADMGFDDIQSIPLSQAAQTWGIELGRANEHSKTALCILEPGTATVMVVATGAGSVRTAVTNTREHAADLIHWLTTTFRRDGWLPESLHLVGARDDLDAVSGPIGDALPIPVSDSADTQLALSRGAALTTVTPVAVVPPQSAQTSGIESSSRRDRPWVVSHAKKLTISAAAVAAVGAALSLAAGSALNVENVSAQEASRAAAGASVTSASAHAVPARISAPPAPAVQPLAVAPPPAPPAPPEAPLIPAEPVAAAVPEPVFVPVPQPTVSHSPPVAPLVAPGPPVASPPAPIVAPPAAPPPAAPVVVPPAAPPVPLAPPPAPAPVEPPPDPIQAALSPLFGALP